MVAPPIAALMLLLPSAAAAMGSLPPADDCSQPMAELTSITAFVANGCYLRPNLKGGAWAADADRRPAPTLKKGGPERVHQYIRAYYSPAMARWLTAHTASAGAPVP